MHIHPVCLGNITRSVWAEVFGRMQSQEGDGLEFSSSGTMAKTWPNLDEEERITYIASVALELVGNPDNDFAYDSGNGFRQNIENSIAELGLQDLDVQRLRSDREYHRTVQKGLRELLVGTIAPHEKLIRDLAMQKLGVELPPNTNAPTVYDSNIDLYLAMSDSNKVAMERIFGDQAAGKIFTASEYSGVPLVEPELGIFACANMDKYVDYVKQIEKVMNEVVSIAKNGSR